MATCKKSRQQHALAIPLPTQGHINPLMRFCKRLASQEGFTITFVDILPSGHGCEELNKQEHDSKPAHHLSNYQTHEISADTGSSTVVAAPDSMLKTLDIRRVRIPMEIQNLGEGYTILANVFEAVHSLSPVIEELLSRLMHEDPPITCLVSDLYMTGPTQKIADKFSIPRIAFHTTTLSVLLFKNYILEGTVSLDQVLKVVTRKVLSKEDTFVEGLLGLPTLRNGDLMNYHDDNVLLYALNIQILKESKERAHAIVVNSLKELEESSLNVNIGGIPIYVVGPLIEPLDKDTSTSLWAEDKDCMLWLNEQPCSSVLYISFGSVATLCKAQFEEIFASLISSQQRFLWVFRLDLVKDVCYSTLQVDLLSQSHGKGYFVEWAPQIRILSHPSIGAFFTHCGWNSTIEALTLGVPMLCFPYFSDQFIIAKYIIEEWKVGLGFKECKESGLIERNEVERVIQALMVEEYGKLLRKNAKHFKEIIYQNIQLESAASKNIKALANSLR